MVVQETMNGAPGIGVEPGDVAMVVDRRRNRADPRGIIDVGRKLAGVDVLSVAVAIARRVVVESDRDIVVVDPY